MNAVASNPHEEALLEVLTLAPELTQSLWQIVADEGRFYTPAPLPDPWMRLEPRYCYDNAIEIIDDHVGLPLVYVEGYACTAAFPGLPVHHAWCATPDGMVLDPTWDPVGVAYLGIEFPLEEARRAREAESAALVARYGW